MANEKLSGILTHEEHLWDIALRGIGLQLPDEYILRFVRLMALYGLKNLPNITISDFADIEHEAREELSARIKAREEPAA